MKKILSIIMCVLMSLTCSAQWRYGGYGYNRPQYYNPAIQHQRMVIRQQQNIVRQQRAIQHQQMRMAMGYNYPCLRGNRYARVRGGYAYHRVYLNNGCYFYTYNDVRVIVPRPRVVVFQSASVCDHNGNLLEAMNAVIPRAIANGFLVLIQDSRTGELHQVVLQEQD
jgi:hypothetical protein